MTGSRFGLFVTLLCVTLASYDATSQDLLAQTPGDDPAQALLEADRLFAEEAAERGTDGWLAWFEADGTMVQRRSSWTRSDPRHDGPILCRLDSSARLGPDPRRDQQRERSRVHDRKLSSDSGRGR